MAHLAEVATIERSSVDPADIPNGAIYVGFENITSDGKFVDVGAVSNGELKSSKFRFDNGHVLYGKLRPYLAKIAAPDFSGVCSTDILPIRPGPALDRRYLLHFLRTPQMVGHAAKLAVGLNLPRLNPKVLATFEVPLPLIEEQRRIAAILDAADALRAKRRQALAKLDSLTQAIFVDIFGGSGCTPVNPGRLDAVHPLGWAWVPLLDVAKMATGHTPDRAVSEYWNGDISWINLNEIRGFDGRWCTETNAKTTAAGVANSSAVILPKGTVCFSRTASIGFVTVMATSMTTSQDFVNWVCGKDLDPTFLMHALIKSRSTLRASSSGSTHKTIYVRDAERFHVLLPPRPLQDSFVKKVARIEAEKERMSEDLDRLHTLFSSLQQHAFRGEL